MRVPGIVAAAVLLSALTVSPARAVEPAPIMAVVGDSYSAGFGTPGLWGAWWSYTAVDMGWRVGAVVHDPGGGFVNRGDSGTFAEAVTASPIPPDTSFVLIQGGLNDSGADPATIPGAVANLLAIIRRQAPNAVPIVIGSFDPIPDHFYGAHQVEVARRIGDWQAIGDTRYMIGYMCTFEVGPDLVHPTPNGHHQIGDWVAWHMAHNLHAGAALRPDPTGTFYTV